jgi:hypothetical protein
MSLLKTACAIGAVGLVIGCSQSPYPTPRELGDARQEALTGGVHWEILAQQSVDKVFGCLEGLTFWNENTKTHEPYCRQDVDQVRYTPIYVESIDRGVPFGEALQRNMSTEVVERGLELSLSRENSLVLTTRIQVTNRAEKLSPTTFPGKWTALGTSIAVLSANFIAGAVTSGIAADLVSNANKFGGAQVIVTTMLVDGSRVVMSKSDSYFIIDDDLAQYASTAPAADMTTPMKDGAEAPEVSRFTVVSE